MQRQIWLNVGEDYGKFGDAVEWQLDGIEFEEVRLPLYTPEAPAQIRRYSPSGKVPALQHGTVTVWESLAILEYLADLFPTQRWWSEEPAEKAVARAISAEMHAGFQALRTEMPMNCRVQHSCYAITPAVQQDIDRITTLWRSCRQQFGRNGDGLFGAFTISDAMFAPVVLRFRTYGVALDGVCQTYAEFILTLPALQPWLQTAESETEILPQFER